MAFLDASIRATFEDQENFVLFAMITNEKYWHHIDNQIKLIKLRHFPYINDTEVELHVKDMLNMKEGTVFANLPRDNIYSIFSDIFIFLSQATTQIIIIAVLMDKSQIQTKRILNGGFTGFYLKEFIAILKERIET